MKKDKDNLGSRMKENYENRAKTFLTRRTPVLLRLDGKAFHTFTKGMNRPFDKLLIETMQETTKFLCENIQGCKIGYTQSDEITLLVTDYDKLGTDAWFDYNVQKMCSISASLATLAFNRIFREKAITSGLDLYINKIDKAMFDSRCFNIPKEEVVNCFIWRQQDATKNSISMVAQYYFSDKELHGKNGSVKQDMLMLQNGVNWNDFSPTEKRGSCVVKVESEGRNKWVIDLNTPIFSKEREYIDKFLQMGEYL